VLDAMARGVPVLTSTTSALPEVAGNAALLVDPLDADSIAGGLSRLAADAGLREELIQRGLERAREFTWETAVERTWAVYNELR
jgi:glycosyltransferase involved in cell wall biosynthesis